MSAESLFDAEKILYNALNHGIPAKGFKQEVSISNCKASFVCFLFYSCLFIIFFILVY